MIISVAKKNWKHFRSLWTAVRLAPCLWSWRPARGKLWRTSLCDLFHVSVCVCVHCQQSKCNTKLAPKLGRSITHKKPASESRRRTCICIDKNYLISSDWRKSAAGSKTNGRQDTWRLCLSGRRLAGWLAGWLVGWLVGWVAGWLVGPKDGLVGPNSDAQAHCVCVSS